MRPSGEPTGPVSRPAIPRMVANRAASRNDVVAKTRREGTPGRPHRAQPMLDRDVVRAILRPERRPKHFNRGDLSVAHRWPRRACRERFVEDGALRFIQELPSAIGDRASRHQDDALPMPASARRGCRPPPIPTCRALRDLTTSNRVSCSSSSSAACALSTKTTS